MRTAEHLRLSLFGRSESIGREALTDPDLAGTMSTGVLNRLANAAMAVDSVHRVFAEWAMGVDRRKHMPSFQKQGFVVTERAKEAAAAAVALQARKAALASGLYREGQDQQGLGLSEDDLRELLQPLD